MCQTEEDKHKEQMKRRLKSIYLEMIPWFIIFLKPCNAEWLSLYRAKIYTAIKNIEIGIKVGNSATVLSAVATVFSNALM